MRQMTALDHSLSILACPRCGLAIGRVDGSLRCDRGHTFDIARQGYAAFTAGGGPHHQGDTAPMVAARGDFLRAQHYAPIADAISAGCADAGWCVEVAGGTGYYSARVLEARSALNGVTIDVSKHAAKAAARAHPRLASLTGDAYSTLPVASGSAQLVLSVFGPRRGKEVARILAPGGEVVVVTPRQSHLVELREYFSLLTIGAEKEARLDVAMEPLVLSKRTELEYTAVLTTADVMSSIMMGPNAFHHDRFAIQAMTPASFDALSVTVSVTVSRFRWATGMGWPVTTPHRFHSKNFSQQPRTQAPVSRSNRG